MVNTVYGKALLYCNVERWHLGQKDFGLINILTNKASNKKVSKEDAIKYIAKRIKEIESE